MNLSLADSKFIECVNELTILKKHRDEILQLEASLFEGTIQSGIAINDFMKLKKNEILMKIKFINRYIERRNNEFLIVSNSEKIKIISSMEEHVQEYRLISSMIST
jgi:hypothetical protein